MGRRRRDRERHRAVQERAPRRRVLRESLRQRVRGSRGHPLVALHRSHRGHRGRLPAMRRARACSLPLSRRGGERFDRPDFPVTLVTWNDAERIAGSSAVAFPPRPSGSARHAGPAGAAFPGATSTTRTSANHGASCVRRDRRQRRIRRARAGRLVSPRAHARRHRRSRGQCRRVGRRRNRRHLGRPLPRGERGQPQRGVRSARSASCAEGDSKQVLPGCDRRPAAFARRASASRREDFAAPIRQGDGPVSASRGLSVPASARLPTGAPPIRWTHGYAAF